MSKIFVIAKREYRATVRTKAFLVAIVMMPIFIIGGLGSQRFMESRIDQGTKLVAVVDHSGKLFDTLVVEARTFNETPADPMKRGKRSNGKITLEEVPVQTENPDAQRLALSDRVRNGDIFAFIEIAPDILDNPDFSKSQGIDYYSNEPTYDDIEKWLVRTVNDKVRSVRLAVAGIDRAVVDRCMIPIRVENLGLFTRSESGEIKQAESINQFMVFMVPFVLMMLMWAALMMTVQPMLQSVLEEKMQKISEVLLGSVSPFDLMAGKLIGYVGVAVTLIGIYMGGGIFIARHYGYSDLVSTNLIAWFFVFQCMAILMFGSLYLAAGSCCSELREAQSLVMPVTLIMVIPMMTMVTVIRHPASTFSTALSLFPPCTPMLMVVRMATPPGVPLWQPVAGVIGTFLATLFCVWIAGRVFRVGLLLQGKAPRMGDLVKYAFRG